MIKYEIAQRLSKIATATFGPGGYTVYRVPSDADEDSCYIFIADFKHRADAEEFRRMKNESS